ncbi:hypothetical protein ILUMI_09458, partial [Ignelater luminosus]
PQHQYSVLQENMTIDDANARYVEASAAVFKVNETSNALNLTFKLKVDLPDDSKVHATAFKWINDGYRYRVIQLTKTIKEAIEMETFDLQTLFVQKVRPPMIWPIQKGVAYHGMGWVPDGTKFPSNIPGGRIKMEIDIMFANRTKLCTVNWYLKLTYKK